MSQSQTSPKRREIVGSFNSKSGQVLIDKGESAKNPNDVDLLALCLEKYPSLSSFLMNATLPSGETALVNSVKSNDFDLASSLVKAGANVNEPAGEYKTTCLMIASKNGKNDMVQFLLEAGANDD